MTIEYVNRSSILTESAGARPQQVKPSETQEVSSVKAADPQGAVMRGEVSQAKDTSRTAQSQVTDEVVNEMNEAILGVRRELKFSIDKESGRAIVQVWDSETNKWKDGTDCDERVQCDECNSFNIEGEE